MYSHLKSTAFALSLIALLVGFTACAKYPVISQTPGQSPSAQAPAPAR
ncbi:MAG TPA: hypothetical protein VLC73_05195 [Burkholderiales bacterium]|jgi:hypothetical protein|nr:hypothetical protein [Burkholderiales bacterium]